MSKNKGDYILTQKPTKDTSLPIKMANIENTRKYLKNKSLASHVSWYVDKFQPGDLKIYKNDLNKLICVNPKSKWYNYVIDISV